MVLGEEDGSMRRLILPLLYNAAKFRSWGHLGRQLRFHDLKILGHVNEVIPYVLVEVFFFNVCMRKLWLICG